MNRVGCILFKLCHFTFDLKTLFSFRDINVMSAKQSDCLTSLVSYVPELNFGFNLPSAATANHFGTSTNQVFSSDFFSFLFILIFC